jgi:TPR repeat protein
LAPGAAKRPGNGRIDRQGTGAREVALVATNCLFALREAARSGKTEIDMRPVILALVLTLVFAGLAPADTIDDGVNAALAGDYVTALSLLGAGVQRGDARAEFFLGVLYESGTGVPKDTAAAARLYRMSAVQGLAPAQNNLGSLYANGDGVARDLGQAVHWWLMAADQGLPPAQTNLASYYATGTFLPKDLVQAYKWAALAAVQGDREGAKIVATLKTMISPEELANAERLVRAWRPSVATGA